MPDKLRSVDRLLPLKPKVLHILLAVADGPRHGYSIMQEVAERTDGQVRLWPAALYGLLRELEKTDFIVESDTRPAADEDDERRRYFALTPHGKRVLDAEVRRLEAIVNHARSSRALRKAPRMTIDRRAIREDGERLLDDCSRAWAASPSRRRGSRCSGISSSSAPGTISHRHCGRSCDRRQSRSAFHSSSDLASRRRPRSSRLSTRCCCDRFPTINPIGSS